MFLRCKTCGMSENSSLSWSLESYRSKKAKKDPTVEKSAYIFLNYHAIIYLANEDILYTNHQLSLYLICKDIEVIICVDHFICTVK